MIRVINFTNKDYLPDFPAEVIKVEPTKLQDDCYLRSIQHFCKETKEVKPLFVLDSSVTAPEVAVLIGSTVEDIELLAIKDLSDSGCFTHSRKEITHNKSTLIIEDNEQPTSLSVVEDFLNENDRFIIDCNPNFFTLLLVSYEFNRELTDKVPEYIKYLINVLA